MTYNIPDGGQEAHVQHAIGLVEDQVLDTGEVAVAPGHEVYQATRSGDNNVGPPSERLNLRLFADAAENRGHTEGEELGIVPHILVDLDYQFPGGCEEEGTNMTRAGMASC